MTRKMLIGIRLRAERADAKGNVPSSARRGCNDVDMPLPVNLLG